MIVSHKHKFIFFKPWKVGGNSVEHNLIEQCGDEDIIDTTHRNPKDTKHIVGKKIYEEYFKFTITRNPWDRMVSYFWWQDGGLVGKNHRANVDKLLKMKFSGYQFKEQFARWIGNYTQFNEPFYFDKKGNPEMDYYMKFENLNEDYKTICEKLNLDCIKKNRRVSFQTSKGDFEVKLYGENYPVTVNNFIRNIKNSLSRISSTKCVKI